MRFPTTCLAALLCVAVPSRAQMPLEVPSPPVVDAASDHVVEMDTMVVSGVQPGPGMWKVSKGDRALWILGTLRPLPNDIAWLSRDVEAVLDRSQQVLEAPQVSVDAKIGIVRGLMLLPAAMKAGKNPEGAELREVLPADLYARWAVLKQKYIGRDKGIEKKRPIVAANELYERAIRKSGLGKRPMISPVIDAAIKRRKLKPTPTAVKIVIEDPKAAIQDFGEGGIDDIDCFRKTLGRLENDLPLMVERANAWAAGDIEALRRLPYDDQQAACFSAFSQSSVARKRGLDDLPQRMKAAWFAAAESALDKNRVTFATLPISELLKADGYLGELRAKGYLVEEP
ncbi:MAG TPA: TraB/GumN family protein [Pseudoxanthomonas sp.]